LAQVLALPFRALSRLSPARLWALLGVLVALSGVAIGVWSATRPVETPSYYIVRWNQSGKCSIVTEQPDRVDYRLVWYGNLHESASQKFKEFMQMKRCR
jgi:hypothetical protein